MLWEKKIHKTGNLQRLMIGTGFGPGMTELALSADSGVKVEQQTLYVIENDEQEASLLKGSEPYLDTAMEITAIGVADRHQQIRPLPLFNRTFAEALTFVDLLFIRLIDDSDKDDIRYLKGVLYKRARSGKPTVVDSVENLDSIIPLFKHVVPLES